MTIRVLEFSAAVVTTNHKARSGTFRKPTSSLSMASSS
jgi:hypothetical protein